eukprot:3534697-Pleurochrysis_carterae.AAC.2
MDKNLPTYRCELPETTTAMSACAQWQVQSPRGARGRRETARQSVRRCNSVSDAPRARARASCPSPRPSLRRCGSAAAHRPRRRAEMQPPSAWRRQKACERAATTHPCQGAMHLMPPPPALRQV